MTTLELQARLINSNKAALQQEIEEIQQYQQRLQAHRPAHVFGIGSSSSRAAHVIGSVGPSQHTPLLPYMLEIPTPQIPGLHASLLCPIPGGEALDDAVFCMGDFSAAASRTSNQRDLCLGQEIETTRAMTSVATFSVSCDYHPCLTAMLLWHMAASLANFWRCRKMEHEYTNDARVQYSQLPNRPPILRITYPRVFVQQRLDILEVAACNWGCFYRVQEEQPAVNRNQIGMLLAGGGEVGT